MFSGDVVCVCMCRWMGGCMHAQVACREWGPYSWTLSYHEPLMAIPASIAQADHNRKLVYVEHMYYT